MYGKKSVPANCISLFCGKNQTKKIMKAVTITQITPYELEALIQESLKKVLSEQPADVQPEWFDLNGLCAYLPDRPAKQTVYGWVSRQEIPFIKKGKRLIFRRDDIDEWLISGRKPTKKEIAAKAGLSVKNKKA